MKKMLERLITRKYYDEKEEIQLKVDVFFGYSRITEDEYADLCELIEANYPEYIEEENVELQDSAGALNQENTQ